MQQWISQCQVWPNVDVVKVFPDLFIFVCLLIFVFPFVKSCSLVVDVSVRFWVGEMFWVVTVLPLLLLLVGHAIHHKRKAPSKTAVVASLLGTSLVLGLTANHVVMRASDVGTLLASGDCSASDEKFEVEEAWQAAWRFWLECAYTDGGVISFGASDRGIHDCSGYEALRVEQPSWGYLQQMEETYGCAGWCAPGRLLWGGSAGFYDVRDHCSAVASEALSTKVLHLAVQVATSCMTTATLTAIFLIIESNSLRKYDIRW